MDTMIDGVKVDAGTVMLAKGFCLNQTVMTPNGPGIVQGRLWSKENGTIKIMVSHDPKCTELTAETREAAQGRMWLLWMYEVGDVRHR